MKNFLSHLPGENKSTNSLLPSTTTDKAAKVLGIHRSASYQTIGSTFSIGQEVEPHGFLDDHQPSDPLPTSSIAENSQPYNLIGNNASTSTITSSSVPTFNSTATVTASTPINAPEPLPDPTPAKPAKVLGLAPPNNSTSTHTASSIPTNNPELPPNPTPVKAAKVLGLAQDTPSRVSLTESDKTSGGFGAVDREEDASTPVKDTSPPSKPRKLRKDLTNKAPTVDDPFPAIAYYRNANARWYDAEELEERADIHDEVQEMLRTRYRDRKEGQMAMDVARELLYELNDAVIHEVDMAPYFADPMKWFPEGYMVAVATAFLERVEKLDI